MSAPTAAEPSSLLDGTRLPRTATRGGSSIHWGIALSILIDAVVVLTTITSYVYLAVLRGGELPHQASEPPSPTLSALALSLAALTLVPMRLAERAARRARMTAMRIAFAVAALLGAGHVTLGVFALLRLDHRWSSHAYGSIVWTLGAQQTLRAALAVSVTVAMIGFSFRRRYEGERRAPVQALGIYWAFVVVAGALSFFTVYVSPRLM